MSFTTSELSFLASIVTKNVLRFATFREALLGSGLTTGMKKTTCGEFRDIVVNTTPMGVTDNHTLATLRGKCLIDSEQPIEIFVHLRSLQITFSRHCVASSYNVKTEVLYDVVDEDMVLKVQRVITKLLAHNWEEYSETMGPYKQSFVELRTRFLDIAPEGLPDQKSFTALFYDADWPLEEIVADISCANDTVTVKTVFGVDAEQLVKAAADPKTHQSDAEITPEDVANSAAKDADPEVLVCDTMDKDSCEHLAIKLLQKATYDDIVNHANIATPIQVANLFSIFSRSVKSVLNRMDISEILSANFTKEGNIIGVYKAWEAHGCPQDFVQDLVHELSILGRSDGADCVYDFIEAMDDKSLITFVLRLAKAYDHKITWLESRDEFTSHFAYRFDSEDAKALTEAMYQ